MMPEFPNFSLGGSLGGLSVATVTDYTFEAHGNFTVQRFACCLNDQRGKLFN
jgi:hypothetical protein